MGIRKKIVIVFSIIITLMFMININLVGRVFSYMKEAIIETQTDMSENVAKSSYDSAREKILKVLTENTKNDADTMTASFYFLNETMGIIEKEIEAGLHTPLVHEDIEPPSPPDIRTKGEVTSKAIIWDDDRHNKEYIIKSLKMIKSYTHTMETFVEVDDTVLRSYIYMEPGFAVYVDASPETYLNSDGSVKNPDSGEIQAVMADLRKRGRNYDYSVGTWFQSVYDDKTDYVQIVKPIYDKDTIVGFIGVDLDLVYFFSLAGDDWMGYESNGAIISRWGYIIYSSSQEGELHRDTDQNADTIEDINPEIASLVEVARYGNSALKLVTLNGSKAFAAAAKIDQSPDWVLLKTVTDAELSRNSEELRDLVTDYTEKQSEELEVVMTLTQIMTIVLVVVLCIIIVLFIYVSSGILVRPIRKLTQKVAAVSPENLEFEWDDNASDETQVLGLAFKNLVETLKEYIKNLKEVTAANQRIEAELNLGKKIQENAIPSNFPPFPDIKAIDIFAFMKPAKEVGGDFYDFFLLDEGKLALVMADVSGKGIPAALFMMISKTLINNSLQNLKDPGLTFTTVNKQLCKDNTDLMFVTAFLFIIDLKTGECTYSNAGHEPMALCKNGGNFEYFESEPGLMLGVMDDMEYKTFSMKLNPGDKLILFTDGCTDGVNIQGEIFGEESLLESINLAKEKDARGIVSSIKASLDEYSKDTEQFDDITLLCFHYKEDGD